MRFLRNRMARRFPKLGLISDLALVGAALSQLTRRGESSGPARASSGIELALAGGAALRLLNRFRRRRARRRSVDLPS